MEEIKAIIAKYDVGGYVYLGSQTHGEYFYSITPSWSLVTTESVPGEPQASMVRFKTTDLPKTPESERKIAVSIGLIAGIEEASGDTFLRMRRLTGALSQHIDFKHVSKHTPAPPDNG